MNAARAVVWAFLRDPDRRAAWWPALQLDPRLGGAVGELASGAGDASVDGGGSPGEGDCDAQGTIDVWVEGHAVGFTWREPGDPRDTAVLVTLRTQGAETGVTITETGFNALETPAARAADSQRAWESLLGSLSAAIDAAVEADDLPDPDAIPAAGIAGGGAVVGGAAAVAGGGAGALAEGTGAGSGAGEGAGSGEGVAADAGEVEPVPIELPGEVEEPVAEAAEPIEVDAEPELGEHLELDTVSIPVERGPVVLAEAVEVVDVEVIASETGEIEIIESETVEIEVVEIVEAAASEAAAAESDAAAPDAVAPENAAAASEPAAAPEAADEDASASEDALSDDAAAPSEQRFETVEDAEADAHDGEHDTVPVEPIEELVPLVLPEPPAAAQARPAAPKDEEVDGLTEIENLFKAAAEEHQSPEEVDFDSLIRGDRD